jgi:16S rRNA (cytosine967-C5)-methyltransferase
LVTTVRTAAAEVLLAVERGHTTLSAEVERARKRIVDDRDRGLLLELTAGTLRWRAQLDALLAQCGKRPIVEVDSRVRAVLRLAAYQLEHLDRVPAHAVVHEAVETIRSLKYERATGYVNAVLRGFTRERARMVLPARPPEGASRLDQISYLSTTLSHPEWLVARWLDRVTFEQAEAWCRFNNTPPEIALRSTGRSNSAELLAALSEAGIEARPAAFVRNAVRLAGGALGNLPPDLRDEVAVHEEGSQIVAHTVGAASGEHVLDVCAAPGGKTVVMFEDMSRTGCLIAGDRRFARLRVLRGVLDHAGAAVPVVGLDATRALPLAPIFDRVLLDAPCSGLGTLSRDPDVKWSRTATDVSAFASVQGTMLKHAAEAVRPGGRLIYATCSSEPEENEAVVDAFLAFDTRFQAEPASPGSQVANGQSLVDARGFLRTWPFRDGLDAFFAAVLVRRGPA